MKNEYRNVANVKIKTIVTSINVTVNNERNEWENDATDNNWEQWTRKTDMKKDAQAQCLLISFYSSNHRISRFRNKQYLKSFKELISS